MRKLCAMITNNIDTLALIVYLPFAVVAAGIVGIISFVPEIFNQHYE